MDCSGVDGFVGHKDGSVVRICAGKSLDEDPMTVLEPGCFSIGGQPRPSDDEPTWRNLFEKLRNIFDCRQSCF